MRAPARGTKHLKTKLSTKQQLTQNLPNTSGTSEHLAVKLQSPEDDG